MRIDKAEGSSGFVYVSYETAEEWFVLIGVRILDGLRYEVAVGDGDGEVCLSICHQSAELADHDRQTGVIQDEVMGEHQKEPTVAQGIVSEKSAEQRGLTEIEPKRGGIETFEDLSLGVCRTVEGEFFERHYHFAENDLERRVHIS